VKHIQGRFVSTNTVEKVTVLVVDDEPAVRAMAVDMLRALGLEVLDAYNGQDALRLLSRHPEIRLLFTDVRMPGMTGVELAAAARRLRPDLKVIVTSAYVGEDAVPSSDVFVPKPLRLEQLAAAIGSQAASE
jgi:CheY-like chemotaxis protein